MEKIIKLLITAATLCRVNLKMFDNTNITTDAGMTVEMKTYYDKQLLKNAKPKLVHNEFGQKRPIPKGSGKTIEFRKFDPLAKATTPLTEGVTPSGLKPTVTNLTATVKQYGAYIEHSDVLSMTTIDNAIVEFNQLLGQQSGETLDTITREVLNAGTNVQYADSRVAARYLLVGGNSTWANNHYFSCECIRQATRNLKNNKATPVRNGKWVGIVHPDTSYTIKKDTEWQEANKYQSNDLIHTGEIGEYDGCKFVETTEAKIFHAEDLVAEGSTNEARELTVASYNAKVITIDEALSSAEALALADREIIVDGYHYTVASAAAGIAGAATITINETPSHNPAQNDVVYPGEAGAAGRDVYSTLFLGMNAYGTTEIEGLGLQMIVKQLGSGGTSDPLNQRATQGWKASHVAKILTETYMLRVEHTTPYESGAN